jgi:hypothetical protein
MVQFRTIELPSMELCEQHYGARKTQHTHTHPRAHKLTVHLSHIPYPMTGLSAGFICSSLGYIGICCLRVDFYLEEICCKFL